MMSCPAGLRFGLACDKSEMCRDCLKLTHDACAALALVLDELPDAPDTDEIKLRDGLLNSACCMALAALMGTREDLEHAAQHDIPALLPRYGALSTRMGDALKLLAIPAVRGSKPEDPGTNKEDQQGG